MAEINELKLECNELILELSNSDADTFMERDMVCIETDSQVSKKYLEVLKGKLMYIRDEYAFAIILKAVISSLISKFRGYGYDTDKVQKTFERDFFKRNKNFIEQLWYWVVYWNLWYLIQFVANIFLAFAL